MSVLKLISAGMLLVSGVPCLAHDLRGLGDLTSSLNEQINPSQIYQLADQQADPEKRYVYALLLRWKVGQTLKACFFDGTDTEKAFVIQTVKEMLTKTKVNFFVDFGNESSPRSCSEAGPRGDMRFSFAHGCCSAYVGRIAHYPKPEVQNGPSIFLQGVLAYDARKARQVVIHEVFHSWGFEHEHQSPGSSCEAQFNKAKVLEDTGWEESDYVTNLKRLDRDHRSYKWSSYDNASIMKYFFEVDELKNGKQSSCYSEENYDPSPRDLEGLQDAYPASPPVVSSERSRAIINAIPTAAISSAARELATQINRDQ